MSKTNVLCGVLGTATAVAAMFTPKSAAAYDLPVRADELEVGQRFHTFVHTAAANQDEGKDISVLRHITDDNWTSLKASATDDKKVTSYLDYGLPFYAMADGTIVACWRNAPNNVPGSLDKNIDKIPGGGNHFWVRQDDGVFVLYAHAQPGSIPSNCAPTTGPCCHTPKS
jgi:hypothetical protein